MLGLDDTIKKLWAIIDSPRTNAKERIKVITLIRQSYNDRLELIRSEASLIQEKKRMDRKALHEYAKSKITNIYSI